MILFPTSRVQTHEGRHGAPRPRLRYRAGPCGWAGCCYASFRGCWLTASALWVSIVPPVILLVQYFVPRKRDSQRMKENETESCSVVSDSLPSHGLHSPWNSPGQNTGVGSLSLLQGIFPTLDRTQVSRIAGGFFTNWTTREAQGGWGWPNQKHSPSAKAWPWVVLSCGVFWRQKAHSPKLISIDGALTCFRLCFAVELVSLLILF